MYIDFHTHIFPDKIAEKAIPKLASTIQREPSMDGTYSGLKKSMEEETQKAVTEATNGKASVTVIKELYYALLNGEVLTFDD